MQLPELAVIVCVSCGSDRGLLKLSGSLWPNARACGACIAKWGVARLTLLADQTLASATQPTRGGGKCLHCGEPVVLGANGLPSAWCSSCDAERRSLMR